MGFLSNLFGKKEQQTCPICGSPMGFFSKTDLTDGAICDKCVAKVEPLLGSRLLSQMTVEGARELLAEEERKTAALVQSFGGAYPNLFRVDTAYPISPKATEVGMARAKAMKDALAVQGKILAGSFDKGTVKVIRNGQTFDAALVETVPFKAGESVEDVMAAHSYKGAVEAGQSAWLILAAGAAAENGDIIGAE